MKLVSTNDLNCIAEICDDGLDNNVFWCSGVLEQWYTYPRRIEAAAAIYEDGICVGTAVILKRGDPNVDGGKFHGNIGVYVKRNYRNLGLGASLKAAALDMAAPNKRLHGWEGSKASKALYKAKAA